MGAHRGRWKRIRRYRSFWQWLKAPLACKLGWHVISGRSDTGMGVCSAGGTMDMWCDRCDVGLEVPIDDVIHLPNVLANLELWKEAMELNAGEAWKEAEGE